MCVCVCVYLHPTEFIVPSINYSYFHKCLQCSGPAAHYWVPATVKLVRMNFHRKVYRYGWKFVQSTTGAFGGNSPFYNSCS